MGCIRGGATPMGLPFANFWRKGGPGHLATGRGAVFVFAAGQCSRPRNRLDVANSDAGRQCRRCGRMAGSEGPHAMQRMGVGSGDRLLVAGPRDAAKGAAGGLRRRVTRRSCGELAAGVGVVRQRGVALEAGDHELAVGAGEVLGDLLEVLHHVGVDEGRL